MKKPVKRKMKKLWNGIASLRDHEVQRAIKNNTPIILSYFDEKMTLSVEDLKSGKSYVPKWHKSRFGTEPFKLIDFRWKPDKQELQKQGDLFQ